MPPFDLPLQELQTYQSPASAPPDFDSFWQGTVEEADRVATPSVFEPLHDPLYQTVDVFDVRFSGYGGDPICGWLILPRARTGPLPCLVQFIGYGGGRSLPGDHLHVATSGMAHFVMDTRGQGAGWSQGNTWDPHAATGPSIPGFLTRGLPDRDTYYYRRLFCDAARAVVAAAAHPDVDEQRLGVCGASQGGGLALAAAGLRPQHVQALISDVPFLCNYERALEITDAEPYGELVRYLKIHRERETDVMQTLAYFDGLHFAPRVKCPSLFSVGLCDLICPPSSVYSVYNRILGDKSINVYRYNGHEGGGVAQRDAGLRFAHEQLRR